MREISFRDDILPLKDKLFRLALRITLNRAEAEDIVQDTLIRVWEKREEWEKLESIEAFCMTIAKNLAIDRSKKEAKNVELTPEIEECYDTSGPHHRLEERERLKLINQLVNGLPEKQKVVIQLRDIEGKSYKEIAAIMPMTEEQVKINLFRGRQKIKEKFLAIEEYGLSKH